MATSGCMALDSQGQALTSTPVVQYPHACRHLVAKPSPSKFANEPCLSGALAPTAKRRNGNSCTKPAIPIPTSSRKVPSCLSREACLRNSSYTLTHFVLTNRMVPNSPNSMQRTRQKQLRPPPVKSQVPVSRINLSTIMTPADHSDTNGGLTQSAKPMTNYQQSVLPRQQRLRNLETNRDKHKLLGARRLRLHMPPVTVILLGKTLVAHFKSNKSGNMATALHRHPHSL